MEHLLLKAATTATDQGTFEAVISTASPDRDGDVVAPEAMAGALGKWAKLGKRVPLAWVHPDGKGNEDVIGHMDPSTVRIDGNEVLAKGWVDQELERGREAWRLIKSGTVSFSFGYLIPDGGATKRSGGRFNINELDVFEISLVPIGPANNDTRVVNWKDIVKDVNATRAEAEQDMVPDVPPAEPNEIEAMFKNFTPRDWTADGVADDLDGLRLSDNEVLYVRVISQDELAGLDEHIKAVWSTAYVNNLPDSAFLYVESGSKDSEGKTTPRGKRHFPYKDADGNVDLPHLRNALARIPQSNLPDNVKNAATSKAERILNSQKSVDEADKAPKVRSVDPLVKEAIALSQEFARDGFHTTQTKAAPEPPPQLPAEGDLSRRTMEETLIHLRGELLDGQVREGRQGP